MNNEKIFYDVHCHAMNLSHPNLSAFVNRVLFGRRSGIDALYFNFMLLGIIAVFIAIIFILIWIPLKWAFSVSDVIWELLMVFSIILIIIGLTKDAVLLSIYRILNLLAIMDTDCAHFFLLMEQDFKNSDAWKKLQIEEHGYSKVILTPLIMDFGVKKIRKDNNIHYNEPPQKPVVEQVRDVFHGIKYYKKFRAVKNSSTAQIWIQERKIDEPDDKRIFEIYPFLGINPQNYDTDQVVISVLDKYFHKYTGKYKDFYEQFIDLDNNFPEDIEDNKQNFCNFFAGVKVYPLLDFDPWPGSEAKRKKVEVLYKYCEANLIPITSHCCQGGFQIISQKAAENFASPHKWVKILAQYPKLKLNLAHFGGWDAEWMSIIIELVKKYENVYTDFSYHGVDPDFYTKLKLYLNHLELAETPEMYERIISKILFGTDFMINLQDCDSYEEYLNYFVDTQELDTRLKTMFCSNNPARFLWNAD